ncbi:MAG TPA: SdrD B-like domain-containing protein [Anaerolineales bacterium]|nr:SdrD B-like domain-containing protein [Anaerolineales bacterium]
MKKYILIIFLISLVSACTNSSGNPINQTAGTKIPLTLLPPSAIATPNLPTNTPTPQPLPIPTTYGPDKFPAGYNPLTGQRVSDPRRLEYPAILLSISHFPPVARPQAGFSFTPFVYEYYITEGSTRHLAVVYGEFPAPEIPLHGDCEVRTEPITQTDLILGNRVWHDQNQNGIQDPREGGIGGICVDLLDANGKSLQQTTTDSNGYYAFNIKAGKYMIEFEKPSWLEFTQKNIGDEATDSDVDQQTGRTDAVNITSASLLFWDAGLVSSPDLTPTPDPSVELPPAEVGPIRSGRIFYKYMGAMYQDSCLIYASADPAVLAQIPGCATVAHTIKGGGAMLPLERMARISEQNKKFNPNFNYASNLFSDEPPAGGEPATELREYWALLNQSKWTYDAASESWWRYIDDSRPEAEGVLHPTVDRLNSRQLQFENIILMFAEHIVITPTIVDINVAPGNQGNAYLFRDGRMYKIKWSTVATPYEQKTGRGQPMRFINLDGTPAALKPGKTWVIIYSLQSYLDDLTSGVFRARFVAPPGAKQS